MITAPVVLFLVLVILMILVLPIAWVLGLSSLAAILVDGDYPVAVITQRMFTGGDTFALLAIPFSLLAGEIMQRGGLSKRLVDFANSLVGCFAGGLSLVAIIASAFLQLFQDHQ